MARAFIAIGSNVGPEENIRESLHLLARSVRITAVSTFYREPALGRPEDPPFYNGAVAIETQLPPAQLKRDVLRPIEAALGRRRTADKYAPRTIDLDLLLYDDCVMAGEDLVLPDPQIAQRAFVAVPLHELAPELILPGSNRPIAEIARDLLPSSMQPLPEFTVRLRQDIGREEPIRSD